MQIIHVRRVLSSLAPSYLFHVLVEEKKTPTRTTYTTAINMTTATAIASAAAASAIPISRTSATPLAPLFCSSIKYRYTNLQLLAYSTKDTTTTTTEATIAMHDQLQSFNKCSCYIVLALFWQVRHKLDDVFGQPKCVCFFELVSPVTYESPRTVAALKMFELSLDERLNEYSYDAQVRGSFRPPIACRVYSTS